MDINEEMAKRIRKLPEKQHEQVRQALRRLGNAETEMNAARDHMRELFHRLGLNK